MSGDVGFERGDDDRSWRSRASRWEERRDGRLGALPQEARGALSVAAGELEMSCFGLGLSSRLIKVRPAYRA